MDTVTRSVNMPDKLLDMVINPWLLGADPEFAVLTPPDRIVPNNGETAVNTTKSAGQIGSDHGGRVWELRPSPSASAYVVATNIWKLLMQQEMDKLENFKWKSGALGGRKGVTAPQHWAQAQPHTLAGWIAYYTNNNPAGTNQNLIQQMAQASWQQQQQQAQQDNALDTLGGHVHFGIQQFNAAQRQALNDVTTGLLSLDILPHKENGKRLSITSHGPIQYGHINGGDAVRDCHGHVEYRCAPSWLDKPLQALAALTAYKLAGARPSSVTWPKEQALKAGFLNWLEELSGAPDVDAWLLSHFIAQQGFEAIQADPASDFKPRWRKEIPW